MAQNKNEVNQNSIKNKQNIKLTLYEPTEGGRAG